MEKIWDRDMPWDEAQHLFLRFSKKNKKKNRKVKKRNKNKYLNSRKVIDFNTLLYRVSEKCPHCDMFFGDRLRIGIVKCGVRYEVMNLFACPHCKGYSI